MKASTRPRPMLLVGTNKQPILELLPDNFLLIDDGRLIDALDLSDRRRKKTYFDTERHHFNPIKDITHIGIEQFVSVIAAAFPAGATTLTKENGLDEIEIALHEGRTKLDRLIPPPGKKPTPEHMWAYRKIQKLLRSPVLKRVLLKARNFSTEGILIARLDRKVLGDRDAFILGNFLIGQFQGQIVIPDYGFYAAPHHTSLIHEGRLIAGVNYLDELPDMLKNLFLLHEVEASHCTADDAETLAVHFSRFPKGTIGFTSYVQERING